MPERPTVRIDVYIYADRNFPLAHAIIPTTLLYDFDKLLDEARERYPAYSYEQLMRYIWVRGLDTLRRTLDTTGIPPDPNGVPRPVSKTRG